MRPQRMLRCLRLWVRSDRRLWVWAASFAMLDTSRSRGALLARGHGHYFPLAPQSLSCRSPPAYYRVAPGWHMCVARLRQFRDFGSRLFHLISVTEKLFHSLRSPSSRARRTESLMPQCFVDSKRSMIALRRTNNKNLDEECHAAPRLSKARWSFKSLEREL